MRKTNIWFLNLLFFTGIGLGNCNQADKDSKYITVNVNENYPEKEIVLQDFMDVEYIPLETTDEFITQGAVLSAYSGGYPFSISGDIRSVPS